MTGQPSYFIRFPTLTSGRQTLLSSGLSDLLLQLLAGVADALVLVGVGLAERAHIGSNLAYLLPVNAGDGDMCLLRVNRDLNASRQRKLDRVRVAKRKDDSVLALHLDAVTDADNVQLLGPAGGNTLNCIEDQRAGEAMKRSLLVVLALSNDGAVLLDERYSARKQSGDLALGAFDQDGIAVDGVLDTSGHWDWLFADT